MRAVWDPGTARATLLKHGVRFADAECALFDPQAIKAYVADANLALSHDA